PSNPPFQEMSLSAQKRDFYGCIVGNRGRPAKRKNRKSDETSACGRNWRPQLIRGAIGSRNSGTRPRQNFGIGTPAPFLSPEIYSLSGLVDGLSSNCGFDAQSPCTKSSSPKTTTTCAAFWSRRWQMP